MKTYKVFTERNYCFQTLTIFDDEQGIEVGTYGGDYQSLFDFHAIIKKIQEKGHKVYFI